MSIALALAIIGRLLPVLINHIENGDNWREIKLGDIPDLGTCAELELKLRKERYRSQ